MPPYLPFLEALGQHIQVTPPDLLWTQVAAAPQMLATLLPELISHLGGLPVSQSLPPEQARYRLYEAIGAFLEAREAHDYQVVALAAWDESGRRGSIVLPTGAGKTFIAIQAISRVNRSTVVVAPTIDLLHQWYARLVNAFAAEVEVYYGSEKKVLPLTVTTYHSAGDLMAEYGHSFKLVIFDEF